MVQTQRFDGVNHARGVPGRAIDQQFPNAADYGKQSELDAARRMYQFGNDIENRKPMQSDWKKDFSSLIQQLQDPEVWAHFRDLATQAIGVQSELTNSDWKTLQEFMDEQFIPTTPDTTFFTIRDSTNMCFNEARGWIAPRDPLVLDLDGDGIEAVGIDPARPILFDHDGDGTRNATGWIKGDDGLVVLDRNGNGVIDSGRELFGDQTLKPVGSDGRAQTYANGYEALAAEDGNGDKVIDANDAVYSQLRIWKDINQDGISQAGELHTLADLGIARIGVAGTASNVNLGNGNTQPLSGSFTRTDGTTGASGVAEVTGSLLLASNNFYREFTDDPAVTAAAGALPQMGGSGWVRDLRKAMNSTRCSGRYRKSSRKLNGYTMKGISF